MNSHQDFDVKIQETASWLDDISDKLAQCADFNISGQQDLEGKLASVHVSLFCVTVSINIKFHGLSSTWICVIQIYIKYSAG